MTTKYVVSLKMCPTFDSLSYVSQREVIGARCHLPPIRKSSLQDRRSHSPNAYNEDSAVIGRSNVILIWISLHHHGHQLQS